MIIKEVKNYKEKINKEFPKISNQMSNLDKNKFFIEQNINYSSALKKYVKVEKENYFKNYINIENSITINKIENLEKKMNSNKNSDFILSLIGIFLKKIILIL